MYIVNSKERAQWLLGELETLPVSTVVSLDTETTGWDPKDKVSPVGRAIPFCMTLAWAVSDTVTVDAYIEAEYIDTLRQWLESEFFPKVGSNIYGYDKHVLGNIGICLRGIVGDTQRMSQLLDPSKSFGHGLKPWGTRLGFTPSSFRDVASRLRPGKVRSYKRDAPSKGRYAGASFTDIDFSKLDVMSLTELWEHYPQRREKLMAYAVEDAVMSLHVYNYLKEKLNEQSF